MSFLTDGDALQAVADALKQASVDDLPGFWGRIVARSNVFAYQEILGRLIRRGLSKAQIDQWDRGAEVQTDLLLWRALTEGGALEAFDRRWVDSLDRREELDTAMLFVSGAWTAPAQAPGTCRTGSYDQGGVFGGPGPADEPDYTEW